MSVPARRKRGFGDNPILTKELRTRMRGARAFWILFVYLSLLSIILFVTYLTWWQSQRGDLSGQNAAFTVGKTFYGVLFTVQALLVGLITPALTSGGVSIEKEQRTFELLSVSLLPRRAIILGKLTAAVSFVVLLLTSSLPLVSIGFLLGGISPAEVAAAFFLLVVTAFLYGSIGIACSAIAKSTATATVMAYGTILLLFFSTLPLTLLAAPGFFGAPGALGGGRSVGLTALNPIGAVAGGTTLETFWGVHCPAWVTAFVLNGFLGVIFTLIAVHRLEYPRSDRSGLLRVLTAIYIGLAAFCLYSLTAPGSAISGQGIGFTAILTILLPFVTVPIFTTGEGLPTGRLFRSFLDPRRLGKGEAPSGLVYCLLLTFLCGTIFVWGAHWIGTHGTASQTQPNLFTGLRPTTVPKPGAMGEWTGALFGLTAAVVFFFGACGLFFSALTGNRWSALSLTATAMVLLYILPPTIATGRDALDKGRGSAWDNLLYLSPLPGILEMSSDDNGASLRKTISPTNLAFGGTPFYSITPFIYAGGGCLLLFGVGVIDRARRQREAQTRENNKTDKSDSSSEPVSLHR